MNGSSGQGAGEQIQQRPVVAAQASARAGRKRGAVRAAAMALALAASGVFASGAWAQFQPDPAATNAAPGNAAQPGAQPAPNQPPPGMYRPAPGGYGAQFDDLRNNSNNNQQNDFPAAEMGATVDAYARATAARAAYDRAYSALNMAVTGMRHQFEESADYHNAQEDMRRAYDDLLAARRTMVAKISQDPKYQAAVSLRDDLTHRIAQQREHDVKIEQLVAMAMVKLGYATTATAMEVVASADDPRIHDARERLMSAGTHAAELERNFDDKVRTDPGMLALRRNLEEARTNNLIAAAVLQGSIDVSDEAINYAYYRHRYDYAYAASANGYYGYGYGYPVGVVTTGPGR